MALPIVDLCARMAFELHGMSCQAQENKDLCAQLAQDAQQISSLVRTITSKCCEMPSQWNTTLAMLQDSLFEAETFVKKYGQTKAALLFVSAKKVRGDHDHVKQRLRDCINNLQLIGLQLNLINLEETHHLQDMIKNSEALQRTETENMEKRLGEKVAEVKADLMEMMVQVMQRLQMNQQQEQVAPSSNKTALGNAAAQAGKQTASSGIANHMHSKCSSSSNGAARSSVHDSMMSVSTLGSQVHGKMFDDMVASSVRESVAFMQSSMPAFSELTPALQQELQKQAQQTDDEAQKAALQCMMAELSKVPADAASAPPEYFKVFLNGAVLSPTSSPHSSLQPPANNSSQQCMVEKYPSLTPQYSNHLAAPYATNVPLSSAGNLVNHPVPQKVGGHDAAALNLYANGSTNASSFAVAPEPPRAVDLSVIEQPAFADPRNASDTVDLREHAQQLRAAAEKQMTWQDWKLHRSNYFHGHDVTTRIYLHAGANQSVAAAMSAVTLGCTISLCGRVQCGEDVVIQTPYLRIEGGDLDILAGHKLIIEAQGVELQDVRITGQVRVQGSGTTVAMRNVTISNADASGVTMHVRNAATLHAFNSTIEGNNVATFKLPAIMVSGEGSKVFFEASTVQHACGAVMHVKDGASCLLRRCRVLKSLERQGICVEGSQSTLVAFDTEVCSHQQICVYVYGAASVMMCKCNIGGALGEAAVFAVGKDGPGRQPFVYLHECQIFANSSSDVVAGKGAYVALSACRLRSSGKACLKVSASSKLAIDNATVVEDGSVQTISQLQLFNLPAAVFDGLRNM